MTVPGTNCFPSRMPETGLDQANAAVNRPHLSFAFPWVCSLACDSSFSSIFTVVV